MLTAACEHIGVLRGLLHAHGQCIYPACSMQHAHRGDAGWPAACARPAHHQSPKQGPLIINLQLNTLAKERGCGPLLDRQKGTACRWLHVHGRCSSRVPSRGRQKDVACPWLQIGTAGGSVESLTAIILKIVARPWDADRHGTVLDNPPLPEEIALDPILGAFKLVAWSGNDALLPRGGDRGAPRRWFLTRT